MLESDRVVLTTYSLLLPTCSVAHYYLLDWRTSAEGESASAGEMMSIVQGGNKTGGSGVRDEVRCVVLVADRLWFGCGLVVVRLWFRLVRSGLVWSGWGRVE